MKSTSQPLVIQKEDSIQGIALIAKNDCYTCHQIEDHLIGPSFVSVSEKYSATEKNLKMLTEKIIEGGKGHWGKIMMTHHPSLSQEDAEAIVKYILLLKK
jgi:cytochrome c